MPMHMLRADNSVVNGVSAHPSMPLLATCGIDDTIKIIDAGPLANNNRNAGEIAEQAEQNRRAVDRSRAIEERFYRFAASDIFDLLAQFTHAEPGDDSSSAVEQQSESDEANESDEADG